jgi:cobalt-precorrin 5A hydrolase
VRGIIVRDIGPYLQHKSIDPAVLCLSLDGAYLIPVLSGHLGGANEIALDLSKKIGAKAVITTASDLLGKTAVDMLAKANDLIIDSYSRAKEITAMIIHDQRVDIISEVAIDIDGLKENISETAEGAIYIGYKQRPNISIPFVKLLAKRLVLGIGARRDTPYEAIINLLMTTLDDHNIDIRCIKKIVSIDLKANEKGILELADHLKVPFLTYTSSELEQVMEGFESSDFVKKTTGVGAVSMPSAYLGSNKGQCLIEKIAQDKITLSLWEELR